MAARNAGLQPTPPPGKFGWRECLGLFAQYCDLNDVHYLSVIDQHALHRASAVSEEDAIKHITKELENCTAYKRSMVVFHVDQLIQVVVSSSDAGAVSSAGAGDGRNLSESVQHGGLLAKLVATFTDHPRMNSPADGDNHAVVLVVSDMRTATVLQRALGALWPECKHMSEKERKDAKPVKCHHDGKVFRVGDAKGAGGCAHHPANAVLVCDPAASYPPPPPAPGPGAPPLPPVLPAEAPPRFLPVRDKHWTAEIIHALHDELPVQFRNMLVWSCCGGRYMRSGVGQASGCEEGDHETATDWTTRMAQEARPNAARPGFTAALPGAGTGQTVVQRCATHRWFQL